MPRTVMKASMCTGGNAKRVKITRPASHHLFAPLTGQAGQVASSAVDTQYCSLCQDGGQIWICDMPKCNRAVCSTCIKIPKEEVAKLAAPNVTFICVSCHWLKCRNEALPYYGFTINGAPILNNFLEVQGNFETSTNATVHSPPILLIHFYLDSITQLAHFKMTEQLLTAYYPSQVSDNLRVLNMPFNLGHLEAVKKWETIASEIVSPFLGYSHVFVFVTTHSDPDTGDLWLGNDENGEVCATTISDWFDIVLGPFKAILSGSAIYMMACGAIVSEVPSIRALRQGFISLGIKNALAFEAKNLTTVNAAGLLANLTKAVVIHGFDFPKALEHNLKESITLAKHSNIFHFSSLQVTHYIWAHRDYQPWGMRLPLQCNQCGILNPWVSIHMKGDQGQAYHLMCKNGNCGKEYGKSPNILTAPKPDDCTLIKGFEGAGWLRRILQLD